MLSSRDKPRWAEIRSDDLDDPSRHEAGAIVPADLPRSCQKRGPVVNADGCCATFCCGGSVVLVTSPGGQASMEGLLGGGLDPSPARVACAGVAHSWLVGGRGVIFVTGLGHVIVEPTASVVRRLSEELSGGKGVIVSLSMGPRGGRRGRDLRGEPLRRASTDGAAGVAAAGLASPSPARLTRPVQEVPASWPANEGSCPVVGVSLPANYARVLRPLRGTSAVEARGL